MTHSEPKVALVTGAARGIGLATAKRFLTEGWRVALLDIAGELLDDAAAALKSPEATLALHCDVSDATQVATAMESVAGRFGRLDALVNNAGIAVFAPLLETSDADWNRVLAVNLGGPFLCTKAAVPFWYCDAEQPVPMQIAVILGWKLRIAIIGGRADCEHPLTKLARAHDDSGLFVV